MSTNYRTVDWGGNDLIVKSLRLADKPGLPGSAATISATELGYLDAVTAGTIAASKAVVANSSGTVPHIGVGINHTTGATRTLAATDAGATVFLNLATGVVVTLPAPVVGMSFDFVVLTSVTSNAYKVITSAGSIFIKGLLVSVDTDTTNALAYDQVGNGTTHVAINMNGTTTGGLIYTQFRLTAMSSTVWAVSNGLNFGSGTVSTPFATS